MPDNSCIFHQDVVGPNLLVNWGGGVVGDPKHFYDVNPVCIIYIAAVFACVWQNSHCQLFRCCGVNEILLVCFLFV